MAQESNEDPSKQDTSYHYLVGVVSFGPKHWLVSFLYDFFERLNTNFQQQLTFLFIALVVRKDFQVSRI